MINRLFSSLAIFGLILAVPAFAETEEEFAEVRWACAANNVKGSGPYWGYGVTEEQARVEAVRVCNQASLFRCWPVPDSCSEIEAE